MWHINQHQTSEVLICMLQNQNLAHGNLSVSHLYNDYTLATVQSIVQTPIFVLYHYTLLPVVRVYWNWNNSIGLF